MRGFISYAHEDHGAFSEMRTHLRATERIFGIDFWADKRIAPGRYWRSEIADAIDAAQIHILLFSPAFIRSDYIFDHELPAINNKCVDGDLVLPIVIDRCAWAHFVGVLQAAPTDYTGRLLPVCEWQPRRHGFDAAREQIELSISAHFPTRGKPLFSWGKP
jgi:hypothetical protein